MGASFVDIGLGRNAFLYVDAINKTPLEHHVQGRTGFTITEKVNRGDDVLVQIVKEPRGLKGARVDEYLAAGALSDPHADREVFRRLAQNRERHRP